MNRRVFRQIVLMDLYRFRWVFGGVLAGAVASLALIATGGTGTYVGGVSFLTTVILLGVLMAMFGVLQERKDNNWLFLLSLPVSPFELAFAKAAGNALGYFASWTLLTLMACAAIRVLPIPDGGVPFAVALMGYMAAYYVVLLAVGMVSGSQAWAIVTMVAGNVSVSYLIYFLVRLPGVAATGRGPVAVWTADIVAILVAEALVILLTTAVAAFLFRRKREFI